MLGEAFNSLVLTIMNVIKAGISAIIASAMAMINAINGLASLFNMISQIIDQIVNIVNVITTIMMAANAIQTAIEVATCGIGALITRVVLPVIAAIIINYAIPEIISAWTGISFAFNPISIDEIISIALGGIPELIVWLVSKINAVLFLLGLLKWLQSNYSYLSSIINSLASAGFSIFEIILLCLIYLMFKNVASIIGSIIGIPESDVIKIIIKMLKGEKVELSFSLDLTLNEETVKLIYDMYLYSVSIALLGISIYRTIQKLRGKIIKWDSISCHTLKDFLIKSAKWIGIGMLLEIVIESFLYKISNVKPSSFVKLAKKKYNVIPTMIMILTAIDILGEYIKIFAVLSKKLKIKDELMKTIVNAYLKRILIGTAITVILSIISLFKKVLQNTSDTICDNKYHLLLSIITTTLTVLSAVLSIIYSTRSIKKSIQKLYEWAKWAEGIWKKQGVPGNNKARNWLIKLSAKYDVKIKKSKIIRVIGNAGLLIIYLLTRQELNDVLTNILLIIFTLVGLGGDAKEDKSLSIENELTLFLIGINTIQLISMNTDALLLLIPSR